MENDSKIDLSRHTSIINTELVSKIAAPLITAFNIRHFRYLKLYSNGARILLSNYADCTRFLYEQGHYKKMWFDGEFPQHLKDGWYIWDVMRAVNCGGEITPFEKEINQLLNLYHGMTCVTQCPGFYEIYTFDSNNPEVYQVDKKLINHFILYFKEQAKKLISDAENEKIIIPLKKNLNEYDRHPNKEKINEVLNSLRINRYYLGGKFEGQYLTAKEAQCIYWLIQGKSSDEIAMIEGNSMKTVECHLEKVRKKFNCTKQTQLVRIILEAGIFASANF